MVQYRAVNTHTQSFDKLCSHSQLNLHFVALRFTESKQRNPSCKVLLYTTSEPLSGSKLFQHSQRSPCLQVHAYCLYGPKTIWTSFCCVLSFFHTSIFLSFSLVYSPMSPCRLYAIPLDFLRLSGCNTTELWQQSETWAEITKKGNWETADWEEVRWRWRPCLCHSALRTTTGATRSV